MSSAPNWSEGNARQFGPWPELVTARSFLRSLVGYSEPPAARPFTEIPVTHLAPWLVQQGLGPLACYRFAASWPALASALQSDFYAAAAENSVHLERLSGIATNFDQAGIPLVLLKGAALSLSVYADPALRPMSDVDLWVRPADIPVASRAMVKAGYAIAVKHERPPALQEMAGGELAFVNSDGGLVELHWSPFSGWWLHYTCDVDQDALWERIGPVQSPDLKADGRVGAATERLSAGWHTLSVEDTILHLAWHLGVNHQFGMWPVRSLVDLAMVIQQSTVDWQGLARRAREWRLATVLWTTLLLVQQLIGPDELAPELELLRPRRWRHRLLSQFVSPHSLIMGRDVSKRPARYPLLFLLVDRLQDMLRLAFRTLWPEQAWLQARYRQSNVSRWRHLWNMLRHRTI